MIRRALLICAAWFLACSTSGYGQVAPGGALQQSLQSLEELRREQELSKRREQEKGTIREEERRPAGAAAEDEAAVIFVHKIEVEDATLVPELEVRAIVDKYEGREVSIGTLNQLPQQINELYRLKGFLAQAVFPEQDVSGGIVRIRVVEGRIGRIIVENNHHTRSSYITDRLTAKSGDPVRLDQLEQELLYFNITNDVKLEAELRPGEEVGLTDLHIVALEPPNFRPTLFGDNSGRTAWGLHRFGFMLTAPSVFGYRDTFSLTGIGAEGLLAGSASYSIPITRSGTRFGIRYDRNEIDIIGGPLHGIQSSGNASDLAFFLIHPLLVTAKYQFEGLVELHGKRSETVLVTDDRFTTDVRTAVWGGNLQYFDKSGVWFIRNEFTHGFAQFGGESNYFKYNLLLLRQQRITEEILLIVRGAGQATPDQLLPSTDQFFIGGISTVPGYSEALLNGDNGYFLGAELNFPIFPKSWESGFNLRERLKGLAFLAHGGSFPFKFSGESINSRDFLSSGGVGFLFDFSKYFSGKVMVGFPFEDRPDTHESARVHFFIQSNFF